ncbi:MAG: hypothetical protein WC730_02120 [Patescibacteria group bacterium]|jgi:hypothetical protein
MYLARPKKTKKERLAIFLIGVIGVLVVGIWLFQLEILFSKGAENISQELIVSKESLQSGIDYAESMQESLPITQESISDIFQGGKETIEAANSQSLLETLAKALRGKYEAENPIEVQVGLPKAEDAPWTIVDDITIDEEGNPIIIEDEQP